MCKKREDGYISLGHIVLFFEIFAGVIDDASFLNLNRTEDKTKMVPPYKLVHPRDMAKNETRYATTVDAKETKNINFNCYRPLKYFLIRQFRKRARKKSGLQRAFKNLFLSSKS